MQLNSNKGLRLNWQSNGGAFSAFLGLLLVALIAFMVQPAQAQYGASLHGTVADAQGAMIPGAHITITEQDTGFTHEASTDGSGNFFFGGLAPSLYKVEVSHDGFKTNLISNLKIIADQPNGLNVKLEVGGTTTTVTVNAATQPLIDTETGNLGGTITQQQISKMPGFGRDVYQLVQLAPGMFGDGAQQGGGGTQGLPSSNSGGSGQSTGIFVTENQPQATAAGGRTNTNSITIDGVSIVSVTWGGAAVITPNEDTVKEFKVVANPYDAEEGGRFSGAQIKITSQNGTNVIHGSAFFKRDSPGMNAYQRWDPRGNPQRDQMQYNDYGGTAGGPILHNRLFGFFGYETVRNSGVNHPGGWYETPYIDGLGLSGTIAQQLLTVKGAAPVFIKQIDQTCASVNLVQGYNCNEIAGQGLAVGSPLNSGLYPVGTPDPSFGGLLTGPGNSVYYDMGLGGDGSTITNPWNPLQQIANPANLSQNASIMFLETNNPSTQTNVQYNGRVDWQATQKDLLAFTLYYTPVTQTSYNGASRAYNFFHHNAKNYSIGALFDHTFNDHIITQARADMAGWKWNEIKDNPQEPLGLPDDNITNYQFGTMGGAQPAQFGAPLGSEFDQWTLNFKDVTTWAFKTHNIKFGGNVTRLAYLDLPDWQAQPSFDFNNLWDFLNDSPYTESVTSDPRTGVPTPFRKDDRQMVYGFFGQDDWKVRPNLTLNLGLRWDYLPGMTEKNGNQPDVRLGTGANTLTGLYIQLGGNEFTVSKLNFGPEFGFAWSPLQNNGRLVVHGGFGVHYDGLEQAITTNNRFNPPFAYNAPNLFPEYVVGSGNPHLNYAAASSVYSVFSFPANTSVITAFNSALLPVNGANGVTGFPSHMTTAYMMSYSLNAQYDLGHQWVATLGYQGSTGRHLPVQYNLLNELAPQLISGAIPVNPLVNNIDWYQDTGISNFNALLGELKHDMAHGFELDAQYRWAKSMDNGSNPYATPDYQFLPNYNYGPSDYDVRNAFKLSGLWAPTIFRGQNSIFEKLLGNWTFGGIMNLHSGFPFNPTFGGIACNAVFQGSGNCNLRPAAYLGGAGSSDSTDVFKNPNGNFNNWTHGGANAYFTAPSVNNNGPLWNTNAGPQGAFTPIPQAPGVGRNSFYGPRYFDTDLTLTKAFVLPNMKVLGDNARFEIRANAYNLFNKLNLSNNGIDTNLNDSQFGGVTNSSGVLAGRLIEMEAHFKF